MAGAASRCAACTVVRMDQYGKRMRQDVAARRRIPANAAAYHLVASALPSCFATVERLRQFAGGDSRRPSADNGRKG